MILIDNSDYILRNLCDFKSNKLIITFSEYTNHESQNHLNRKGFGENFFANNRIDAFHFISKKNEWWQYDSIEEAIHMIRIYVAKCTNLQVFTYGSSMGGMVLYCLLNG